MLRLTEAEKQDGSLSAEHLTDASRTFRDVGYVVIDNVYSSDFIAEVKAAYNVQLEAYIQSRGGIDALNGKTFGKNHIGFFPQMFAPIADTQIVAHPVAVQVLNALLGKDFHSSFFHTNTALPGSGYQPIHRDTLPLFSRDELAAATPAYTLVLNIPLCDFTLENGSTEVWPGTHLIVDDSDDKRPLEERAALLPSARTNVPAGCLVLRDMRMWHRGVPNNSTNPRTMFALVYHRKWIADETISIPQTTWDSWSDDARHIYRKNHVITDVEHIARRWPHEAE